MSCNENVAWEKKKEKVEDGCLEHPHKVKLDKFKMYEDNPVKQPEYLWIT